MRLLLAFCLSVLIHANAVSQTPVDTSNFYVNLKKRSNHHEMTKMLYEAFFKSLSKEPKDTLKVTHLNPFHRYQGHVVRTVNVIVLDPFGYSVNEFYGKKMPYATQLANQYHITTREFIIRNLLLFRENEALDPLKLSESERLMRTTPYVNDARIYVNRMPAASEDSVDITVVVQDRWSISATGNLDAAVPSLEISDNNLFGMGHQYTQGAVYDVNKQLMTAYGKYAVFNFKKSYIGASVSYSTLKDNQFLGFSVDRPLFSPLAKWAGGMSFLAIRTVFPKLDVQTTWENRYPLEYHYFDMWGAKSFPVRALIRKTDQRSSNFILGGRYFRTDYSDRPNSQIDSNNVSQNSEMILFNGGFAIRKYYKGHHLFRFGSNEDVPEGKSIELLLGRQRKQSDGDFTYFGVKSGIGEYVEHFGYCSLNLGYGVFTNGASSRWGVLTLDAFYFSPLATIQSWKIRQFIRYKVVEGIQRDNFEYLNINGNQLYGFDSKFLLAKSKMLLNFETVVYTPYRVLGFQFAPILFYGIAGIGDNFKELLSSSFYNSIAIGLLIRNEYLVANTFQVSIGFYPYMPGFSNNQIKLNPISGYRVSAHDYVIAKPDMVQYQ